MASGTFGERFPELGAATTAPALPIPTATRPIPAAALPTPSISLPSAVALSAPEKTASPGLAPAGSSAPENTPVQAAAVFNDEQPVQLARNEVTGPAPRENALERRNQGPLSRRVLETHVEPISQAESPPVDELTDDDRALADAVLLVNLTQPVSPALELIATRPTAEWNPVNAAPSPETETRPLSSDRPPPLFVRATPSPATKSSPVLADAGDAHNCASEATQPNPSPQCGPEPIPTLVTEAPPAPRGQTFGTSPQENRPVRRPVARPVSEADQVSSFPASGFRSTPNPITAQAGRADFPQTLPGQSMQLPASAAAPLRSAQPPPAALPAASEQAGSDEHRAQAVSREVIDGLSARPLDVQPVAAGTLPAVQLAAKFAPRALGDGAGPLTSRNPRVKTFVNAAPESLTLHQSELGIGVAKPPATMSERSIPALPPHPMSEYGMAASALAVRFEHPVASAAMPLQEGTPAEAVNSAQRAVEVALRAVDVATAGGQKSVNLDFAVGDADLQVRIEIRADEVHTTFRTDSPELRTALAQEWQAVSTPSAADRGLRLAPATFATADAPSFDAANGDASSRERHAPARQDENPPAAFISAGRTRAAAGDHSVSATTAIRSLVAAATSRHLHTLA